MDGWQPLRTQIWKKESIHNSVHAKTFQSCSTLCGPMDCSRPGSSVHGILQARIVECIVMLSSRGSSPPRDGTHVSYISCIGRQVFFFTTSATWEALFMTAMKTKTQETHRHFRHMWDLKTHTQTYWRTINMEYMKRCSNSEGEDPRV